MGGSILQGEFKAVVLAAGKGSRMTELTANKPKCLLPLGPKPLIWYPLKKLVQLGFKDAIIVVQEEQKTEIEETIRTLCDLSIVLEYVVIHGSDELGTADSLRSLSGRIGTLDVMVMSCDLVTDCNFSEAVNMFRVHNASVVTHFFETTKMEPYPGIKSKYKPERDIIGIDKQTNRLVFLASSSDFESELRLPMALLRKHTHTKFYSRLTDSHVYLLKNWVVRYLVAQPNLSTLKGELLPHIIKKQLARTRQKCASEGKTGDQECIFDYCKENPMDLLIRSASAFNDHTGDRHGAYHGNAIRCYAHISDANAFGLRLNTVPSCWTAVGKINNGLWAKLDADCAMQRIDPRAEIKSNQVDGRCVVWSGARLSEKTSFKDSLIGYNCQVEKLSRVFSTILMGNVTVKEKVALENCIICEGVTIESGCTLKHCIVGGGQVVPANSEHSNEVLTESNELIEL